MSDDDIFSINEFERRRQTIISHPSYNKFNENFNNIVEYFSFLNDLISLRNLTIIFCNDKHYLLNTYLILSSINTLRSIKLCCENGNISDAYSLLRKFRDDIFFYLYLLQVHNNRAIPFDNNRKSEKADYSKQTIFVSKWYNNELRNFGFMKNIVPYLKTNTDIKEAISKHNLETGWKRIFDNLNNYVHNNGISYCHTNFRSFKDDEIKNIIEDIINQINYIVSVFTVFFILIKPHFIMSEDYIDFLDFNETPPEGSQYWVAPFIQEFLDEHIVLHNPELKSFLKDKVYMDIE